MLSPDQIQGVISDILAREGGFVDDPADRGGRTNFGVTQSAADEYGLGDVANLTREAATTFYARWLTENGIDKIPDRNTFALVADSAVNHGPHRAIVWLQRSMNFDPRQVDGIIGQFTQTALQSLTGSAAWAKVYGSFLHQRIEFYGLLAHNDASQVRFISGWLGRACEFLDPWPTWG